MLSAPHLCLQVTGADVATGVVSFDVISETLRATNLGELQTGGLVNFERCKAPASHVY